MRAPSRHVKHAVLFSGLIASAGLACLAATGRAAPDDLAAQLARLSLPAGFHIEVYAPDMPNARQMALSPGGTLFVGTREDGRVFAVVDRNRDQKADEVITIARGLKMPSGVAFKDGALYVGEIGRITRYEGLKGGWPACPRRSS